MTASIKKKIFAICGSTRQNSSNHQLIKAISTLFEDELEINLYNNISQLPHYNPDDDRENIQEVVLNFRKAFETADGILICTPEYAHGVPGSLKNALDWAVSSSSFSGKPTVLITASTDGRYGHAALLETLKVIEAKDVDALQLIIPFIKTKLLNEKITEEKTLKTVVLLMKTFIEKMNSI